jgi:RsiW-degrading membrane proteinase PrsW (M82 family)
MVTEEQPVLLPRKTEAGLWWRVLVMMLLAFCIGVIVMALTGNPILFPTVLMLGSLAVPAAYVAFFFGRRHLSKLTLPTIILGFLYGGVLGVFAAALLEPIFIARFSPSTTIVVGLIEEFAKILGVLLIARHWRHDAELDGLILGAAAGMGFASMESSGYAFVTFLRSGGNLSLMVGVTLLRGILSPVGHGTWTAILASVLFRESAAGHFRINGKVVGAYLTVAVLHGLWDGLPGVVSAILSPGFDVFVGQAIVGGISLFILWRRWSEARRLQLKQTTV